MDTTHKFHIWIIMLLVWNAVLLMLVIGLIYFKPLNSPDPSEIADICAAATSTALKNSCSNL
jgi:hypothetical protein